MNAGDIGNRHAQLASGPAAVAFAREIEQLSGATATHLDRANFT